MTGQPSDLVDDQELETQAFSTTALHEAVRASNYDVVEYLVRTNFMVESEDKAGKTALDLVTDMTSPRDRIQSNRIFALLKQRRTKTTANSNSKALPIGWEVSTAGNGSKVYKETSIRSNTDALTFEKPCAGLLDDKRLVVGERKVKGLGQPYFLDPLRFMSNRVEVPDEMYGEEDPNFIRTLEFDQLQRLQLGKLRRRIIQGSFAGRPKSAKMPHYDDTWYHREIKATASPLKVQPWEDDRVWVRFLGRVLQISWTILLISRHILLSNYLNIFLLFVPLCIVAQKLDWNLVTRVAFSVLAIGPLAAGMVFATEVLSRKLSSTSINRNFLVVLSSCSPEVFVSTPAIAINVLHKVSQILL